MNLKQNIKTKGDIEAIIEHESGLVECLHISNAVLDKGREALASSLANQVSDTYEFFVTAMLFGDDGTSAGVPKFVNTNRNGLFGTTQVNKPVIASIDPEVPSQVIFTSVISFTEGNGKTLNEMALQMDNGDLYSMTTFAGISKTSTMQITWNWRISFL